MVITQARRIKGTEKLRLREREKERRRTVARREPAGNRETENRGKREVGEARREEVVVQVGGLANCQKVGEKGREGDVVDRHLFNSSFFLSFLSMYAL
jgi:hypothetical protein